MVAKRTARSERIQTINQARALIVTGPDDLRARLAGHSADDLVLAATLSAHGSAAFDVDVLAGLGGDAMLRQKGVRFRGCRGCRGGGRVRR